MSHMSFFPPSEFAWESQEPTEQPVPAAHAENTCLGDARAASRLGQGAASDFAASRMRMQLGPKEREAQA